MRDAVADKALSLLPKCDIKQLQKEGYVFDTVEEGFTHPRESQLHNTIRKRVVDEVRSTHIIATPQPQMEEKKRQRAAADGGVFLFSTGDEASGQGDRDEGRPWYPYH